MKSARTTIFVCVTCRLPIGGNEGDFEKPGGELAAAIEAHLQDAGASEIEVRPVECLSVCKRPCTVALCGPSKWTYVVGDLDESEHLEDVVRAARRYAAASDGLVPWRERPLSFRKGVVSRTPPLPVLIR